MRECEKRSAQLGVSLAQLMDNAGEALARAVLKRCTQRGLRRCVILAGKGNNGGDGFVAAEFLAFAGVDVTVLLCCGEPATELAKAAFAKMGGAVKVLHPQLLQHQLQGVLLQEHASQHGFLRVQIVGQDPFQSFFHVISVPQR